MAHERPGFFSRKQIAEIFGFSVVYFDRDVRPHLPPDAVIRGQHPRFKAAAIVEYLVQREVRRHTTLPLDGDDALLAGADSPWLEAYRKERTLSERLRRLQAERQLVPIEQVTSVYNQWAALVRSAADKLQKKFGRAAHDLFDRALAEAEAIYAAYMAELESCRIRPDDSHGDRNGNEPTSP